jgi:hypothetical protein
MWWNNGADLTGFGNPEGRYFVSFAVQGYEAVFTERAQITKSVSAGSTI